MYYEVCSKPVREGHVVNLVPLHLFGAGRRRSAPQSKEKVGLSSSSVFILHSTVLVCAEAKDDGAGGSELLLGRCD